MLRNGVLVALAASHIGLIASIIAATLPVFARVANRIALGDPPGIYSDPWFLALLISPVALSIATAVGLFLGLSGKPSWLLWVDGLVTIGTWTALVGLTFLADPPIASLVLAPVSLAAAFMWSRVTRADRIR